VRSFDSSRVPPPPFCLNWNSFPQNKKWALEIGAGTGEFARGFCKRNPDWFLLSLERTSNKSQKYFEGSPQQDSNLYFLRADGINVFAHEKPRPLFDKIFLLYPNPYPKKKQSNLRWHNMPFFQTLLEFLKPQGQIEFRTNLEWYAEECKGTLKENFPDLTLFQDNLLTEPLMAQTAFERKYLERGEQCHQLIYQLNS